MRWFIYIWLFSISSALSLLEHLVLNGKPLLSNCNLKAMSENAKSPESTLPMSCCPSVSSFKSQGTDDHLRSWLQNNFSQHVLCKVCVCNWKYFVRRSFVYMAWVELHSIWNSLIPATVMMMMTMMIIQWNESFPDIIYVQLFVRTISEWILKHFAFVRNWFCYSGIWNPEFFLILQADPVFSRLWVPPPPPPKWKVEIC